MTYELGTVSMVGKAIGRVLFNHIGAEVTDVVTTIGSFVLLEIRNKIVRSISFTVYGDNDWMEEALFAILYKYNDFTNYANMELSDISTQTGDALYHKLSDGLHRLKYRSYDIILTVDTPFKKSSMGSTQYSKRYIVQTFNLDKSFVTLFEKDMMRERDKQFKFRASSDLIPIYTDAATGEARTYFRRLKPIQRRSLSTLYLDSETKNTVIRTINQFFRSKAKYRRLGIPHNLKILLYGKPSVGKDTLARVIASEWNRTICYVNGGNDPLNIPESLEIDVTDAVYVISDIDKHPFLVTDNPKIKSGVKVDQENLDKKLVAYNRMLNMLDGLVSGDGRIIIMTANDISGFSPTFLRPGRIDLILELPRVTPYAFRQFVYDNYGEKLPSTVKMIRDDIAVPELQADYLFNQLPLADMLKKYTV